MNSRTVPHYALPLATMLVIAALGIFAFVAGEADDSPGLQLLGAAFVVASVVLGVRTFRGSPR